MNKNWVILTLLLVFSQAAGASGRSGKGGAVELRRCRAELELIRNMFVVPARESFQRKRPARYEGRAASQEGIKAIKEIIAGFELGEVKLVTRPELNFHLNISDGQDGKLSIEVIPVGNVSDGGWAMSLMRDSTRGLELVMRKVGSDIQYRETFYEDGLAHIRVLKTRTDENTGKRFLILSTFVGGGAAPRELYQISLLPKL